MTVTELKKLSWLFQKRIYKQSCEMEFLIDVISELGVYSGSTPICTSGAGNRKKTQRDPV